MNMNSRKKLTPFSQLTAIIILAAFTLEGVSMSFFTKTEEEVVLFSEMEGHITFKGQPVSNVKIERWIKWKDDVGEKDSVVTDSKGFFRLPTRKEIVKSSGISQFVVAQEIRVYYQSTEYPIWAKAKREKQEFSELNGKPVNFRCELTEELIPVNAGRGTLMTSCKWDALN
jgi:hypothetical protein